MCPPVIHFVVKKKHEISNFYISVCSGTPQNFTVLLNLVWQIYLWPLFFTQFSIKNVGLFRKRAIGLRVVQFRGNHVHNSSWLTLHTANLKLLRHPITP